MKQGRSCWEGKVGSGKGRGELVGSWKRHAGKGGEWEEVWLVYP